MVDYPSMENTSIDIFNNKFFVHSGQVLDGVKLNYNYFSKQKLRGSVLNKIRVWPGCVWMNDIFENATSSNLNLVKTQVCVLRQLTKLRIAVKFATQRRRNWRIFESFVRMITFQLNYETDGFSKSRTKLSWQEGKVQHVQVYCLWARRLSLLPESWCNTTILTVKAALPSKWCFISWLRYFKGHFEIFIVKQLRPK